MSLVTICSDEDLPAACREYETLRSELGKIGKQKKADVLAEMTLKKRAEV